MLCALFAFTSCEQNEMNVSRVIGDGFTLVGNSTLQTKTAFGTPESESIPFLWSEGDCIMVNNNLSESLQEGGSTAQFEFISGSVQPGDGVYYGCVEVDNSGKAMVATLPWQDGDCNDVGYNAEFGYAVVDSDNSFTLQHYTSYLWLNSWSSANLPKVSNIKITAENDIVGWCEFDETSREFVGDVTPFDPEDDFLKQTKSIVIEFQDKANNRELTPKKLLSSSSNTDIWAVAVALPVTTGALKIDYEFEDGTYASFNYNSKTLLPGTTYKITQEIKESDLYTFSVLTFEDEAGSTYWSDLIPDENEQYYYGSSLIYGSSEPYSWEDANTKLSHVFPYNWNCYDFSGGGHVISTHTATMDIIEQTGGAANMYNYQLSIPLDKGYNGSENFCIGYHDSNIQLEDDVKPALSFKDNKPRVIDHMYITNASLTLFSMINGSDFSEAFDDDDYMDVVATGYIGDNKVGSVKYRLAEGADMMVTDWVKWDLSSLGAVTKVVFHMQEVQIGYDQWWCTPMYFAYDNIAVRFGVNE